MEAAKPPENWVLRRHHKIEKDVQWTLRSHVFAQILRRFQRE